MSVSFGSGGGDSPDIAQRNRKRRASIIAIAIVSTFALVAGIGLATSSLMHRDDASSSAWVKPIVDKPDAFSAVTSVAYKSGQSFVDTPTYISDQADRARVGDGKLDVQDAMVVALTRARGDVASVDDLWADGGSRYQGQYNSVIALYGTANGDYLVGRASSNEHGAKTVQALAGPNANNGVTYDDIIYDKIDGLVYVPKHYTKDANGKSSNLRIQVLTQVGEDEQTSNIGGVDIATNIDGGDGIKGLARSGVVRAAALDTQIRLQMFDNADALLAASHDDLVQQVSINGVPFDSDSDVFAYDADTGELVIDQAPLGVHDIAVSVRAKNAVASAAVDVAGALGSIGVHKAYAKDFGGKGEIWSGGKHAIFTFPKVPTVNQVVQFATNFWYSSNRAWDHLPENGGGTAEPNLPAGGTNAETTAAAILNGTGIDVNSLSAYTGDQLNHMLQHGVASNEAGGIKLPAFFASLACAHINTPLDTSVKPTGQEGIYRGNAMMRVYQVDQGSKSAIVGFITPSTHTQAGVGMFRIWWDVPPTKGKVTMQKVSADSEYVKTHSKYYSLAGAKYDLKKGDKVVHTFTTGADGKATDSATVDAGTYTICETKASLGHKLNSRCKDVTVKADSNQNVVMDGQFAEELATRPVSLKKESFKKSYSDNNNAYDLTGAEYTLYDENNNVVHVFVTDKDGHTEPVNVKYGRYTLRETKAPHEGYEISDEVKSVEITAGGEVYMF